MLINVPCTGYHMATRALANLSHEGDKLAKRPRGHVITGLLQIARDGLRKPPSPSNQFTE